MLLYLTYPCNCLVVVVAGVLMCVLYILRKCSSFSDAIESNIAVGGDACARARLIGAFFAAGHYPLPPSKSFWGDSNGAIPTDWIDKSRDTYIDGVVQDGAKVTNHDLHYLR